MLEEERLDKLTPDACGSTRAKQTLAIRLAKSDVNPSATPFTLHFFSDNMSKICYRRYASS